MPFEALRFIHAANLHLDHPLRDVGSLPKDLCETVEDATLTAFDNVVDACLENEADFLLLTGNSFDKHDHSLRSRIVLRSGFTRLSEQGIQVFVVPGETDPLTSWKSIDGLPENITLFSTTSDEPVAVIRNKHVIATIAPILPGKNSGSSGHESSTSPTSTPGSERTVPFSIGLMDGFHDSLANCDVDYVAIHSGGERRTDRLKERIAHNPGAVQAMSAAEIGSRGCTLVEVDSAGDIDCTFLPTAPVCWEQFGIDIDTHSNWDEVVDKMHSTLKQCRQRSCEKVWLIQWKIRQLQSQHTAHSSGESTNSISDQPLISENNVSESRSLFVLLHNEKFRDELIEFCEQDSPLHEGLKRVHTIELEPAEANIDPATTTGRFEAEYFEHLANELPVTAQTLQHCLDKAHLVEAPWTERLQSMLGELDYEAIAESSRQRGISWFRASAEEGTAA